MCRCDFRKLETKKRRNIPPLQSNPQSNTFCAEAAVCQLRKWGVGLMHLLQPTSICWQTSLLHIRTMLMHIKIGSWLHQDLQIPPTAAAVISMDTSSRCNWGTKSVVKIVRRLRWHVLQIRKAGTSARLPPPRSWMEMPSQGPFNMNTRLIPTLRPSRELPGICRKQTSTWNGKMFEILLLYFLCALWEELIFFPSCLCWDCPNLTFYPVT